MTDQNKEQTKSEKSIHLKRKNVIPIPHGGTYFGVFFDGTWNNRDVDIKKKPYPADTNVSRLFDLYSPTNHEKFMNNDRRYYNGVGSVSGERLRGGFSGYGATARIDDAYKDVTEHFNKPENYFRKEKVIDVFGFSRGAAQARHFVNMIKYIGIKDERKTKKGVRKSKGNNWVGFFEFFPSLKTTKEKNQKTQPGATTKEERNT